MQSEGKLNDLKNKIINNTIHINESEIREAWSNDVKEAVEDLREYNVGASWIWSPKHNS